MDSVLGLTLGLEDKQDLIPNEIQELLKERDKSREEKNGKRQMMLEKR
jgi:hypothetical protein